MDREKVIKGLTECVTPILEKLCPACPYFLQCFPAVPPTNPFMPLMQDALALLLKEQNDCENCAIAIEDRQSVVRCKDCKWYDERISMCDNCGLPREQTFFCADGKRR